MHVHPRPVLCPTRYSRKGHIAMTDEPDQVKSAIYSNDVELRRRMWLKYAETFNRPTAKEFKNWFLDL